MLGLRAWAGAVDEARARWHRRRRHWLLGLVAIGAAALSASLVLGFQLPSTGPGTLSSRSCTACGSAGAATLVAGRWVLLPPAPIAPRGGAAALWTGNEMFVWGGSTATRTYANGAVLDPKTRTWRMLPPSPLKARTTSASVVAGTSVFIWGGSESNGRSTTLYGDGALYDLGSRTWKHLPPSPLAPRTNASAFWTGSDVVVFGGWVGRGAREHRSLMGAVYDPESNHWSLLPPLPTPAATVAAVDPGWTGHGLDVLVLSHPSGATRLESETWTPGQTTWQALPTSPSETFSLSRNPVWAGSSVYFVGSHTCETWPWGKGAPSCVLSSARQASAVDPERASARSTSVTRRIGLGGLSAWTGRSLVDVGGHVGVALDVSTGHWLSLPRAPLQELTSGVAIWTGNGVLVWGSAVGGSRAAEELLPRIRL